MHNNFVEHLRAQVAAHGDTRRYVHVRDQGGEPTEEVTTYARLDRQARATAAWLRDNAEPGRPVLLLHREAMDFLPAFLGCLYAGVVAVPAPLPHDARSAARVTGMLDDAGADLVLTTADCVDKLSSWVAEAGGARPVTFAATDMDALGDPETWRMPVLDTGSAAFIQYTSGSTSRSRGVVVTHGNLLHNETEIARVTAAGRARTLVSWLPHFHDLGLIGPLLHAFHTGCDAAVMSPTAFLKRPRRWLEVIDRYRAEVTAAPNFAYDLVARQVTDAQLAGLDLSCLRVAMNGAEPIRARTLAAVADRLRPAGFAPEAFVPCYGMAEVTLCASAAEVGAAPVHRDVDPAALERDTVDTAPAGDGTRLVSSGRSIGTEIRVVHPDSRRVLPDDRVGEIWLRGPSVTAGYWNRPHETAETFHARTADGDGPYLRTGDLGFLSGGELFVTGRRKDLVIVNGRNLYPHDIESVVAELHPALAQAAGAAFAVDAGHERIVVVHGVRTARLHGATPAELTTRIKAAVAAAFEVAAPSVVLVPRAVVHLTTSGKVRRRSMRDWFLRERTDVALHEDVEPAVQRLRA